MVWWQRGDTCDLKSAIEERNRGAAGGKSAPRCSKGCVCEILGEWKHSKLAEVYSHGWSCDVFEECSRGERWHCALHQEDFCFQCCDERGFDSDGSDESEAEEEMEDEMDEDSGTEASDAADMPSRRAVKKSSSGGSVSSAEESESGEEESAEEEDGGADDSCQVCRDDEDDATALICDGCDKGYHLHCLEPKLDEVPDGDWFCAKCAAKAAAGAAGAAAADDSGGASPIEKVLATGKFGGQKRAYVKWKQRSYLHAEWITTKQLGKMQTQQIQRFTQKQLGRNLAAWPERTVGDDSEEYFDPSYCVVERCVALCLQSSSACCFAFLSLFQFGTWQLCVGIATGRSHVAMNPSFRILDERRKKEPKGKASAGASKGNAKKGKESKSAKAAAGAAGTTQYLVKWCRTGYAESTWEVESEISDDAAIKAYGARRKGWDRKPTTIEHRKKNECKFKFKKLDGAALLAPMRKADRATTHDLRDYQVEGVNWLRFSSYHSRGCILGDEMGLGKTVQSSVFLQHVMISMKAKPLFLVVVPLSTLGNWQREMAEWTTLVRQWALPLPLAAFRRIFLNAHDDLQCLKDDRCGGAGLCDVPRLCGGPRSLQEAGVQSTGECLTSCSNTGAGETLGSGQSAE